VLTIQSLDPSEQSDYPKKPNYKIVAAEARKNINKPPQKEQTTTEVKATRNSYDSMG